MSQISSHVKNQKIWQRHARRRDMPKSRFWPAKGGTQEIWSNFKCSKYRLQRLQMLLKPSKSRSGTFFSLDCVFEKILKDFQKLQFLTPPSHGQEVDQNAALEHFFQLFQYEPRHVTFQGNLRLRIRIFKSKNIFESV